MGSSGKKKTTMAKLARESRLRERRLLKQAKKSDRKTAPADHRDQHADTLDDTRDQHADTLDDTIGESSPITPEQPALEDVAQSPTNA